MLLMSAGIGMDKFATPRCGGYNLLNENIQHATSNIDVYILVADTQRFSVSSPISHLQHL
jgi:hypothetical protein